MYGKVLSLVPTASGIHYCSQMHTTQFDGKLLKPTQFDGELLKPVLGLARTRYVLERIKPMRFWNRLCLISVRTYHDMILQLPRGTPPKFFGGRWDTQLTTPRAGVGCYPVSRHFY